MKYYKFTTDNGPIYGKCVYDLSGAWQSVEGELKICFNGFHANRADQLPYWMGTELWEVEIRGETIEDYNKICAREIRFVRQLSWDQDKMLRFAWLCAFDANAAACAARAARVVRAARAASAARAARAASEAARRAANWSRDAAGYTRDAACIGRAVNSIRDAARSARAAHYAHDAALRKQLSWIEAACGEKLGTPDTGEEEKG